jgi:hypothetical protein
MPSRWQCLLIVVAWVAATGWLVVRELEPGFRGHEPPPYVVELTAETQVESAPAVMWKVYQNGQGEESYLLKTWMDRREQDDTLAFHADVKPAPLAGEEIKATLLLKRLESEYRINREGHLRELKVEGVLSSRPVPGLPDLGFSPQFRLNAIVLAGEIVARMNLPQLEGFIRDANANFSFPVSQNGAVFLPLHPVNKVHGVRPGRSWRVPEIDPLGNALRAWFRKFKIPLPDRGERFLDARVRDQAEPFPYDMGDGERHVCWVIDYHGPEGDTATATTWVEVDTDLVLCQEAKSDSGSMRVVRDTARSKVR